MIIYRDKPTIDPMGPILAGAVEGGVYEGTRSRGVCQLGSGAHLNVIL